jgi:hypothetical protein
MVDKRYSVTLRVKDEDTDIMSLLDDTSPMDRGALVIEALRLFREHALNGLRQVSIEDLPEYLANMLEAETTHVPTCIIERPEGYLVYFSDHERLVLRPTGETCQFAYF